MTIEYLEVELVPSFYLCKFNGGIKMITEEEKEKLIEKKIMELDIKKTKTFISEFIPNKVENYNELKSELENNDEIKLDGLEIEDIRILKPKKSIIAENCIFTDFQFRNFNCDKIIFINCIFNDFTITGGSYRNITFIACRFNRFTVKDSGITTMVDLTDMTMIRCKFNDCSFSNANLSHSNWLYSDINDVQIVTDHNSNQKCILTDYIGDDIRVKSTIEQDVSDAVKNVDIKSLEKELISNREYENEEIDISMFVNTDFYNTKFNNCTFISKEFEENNLINYEMKLTFINTTFKNCNFICGLKSVLFDQCKFDDSLFKGHFTYCEFSSCSFTASPIVNETVISHSKLINCDFGFDVNIAICNNDNCIDTIICETVEKIKEIKNYENEVDRLVKEKTESINKINSLEKELQEQRLKNDELIGVSSELEKSRNEYELLLNELKMKELEITDLNERIRLETEQNKKEVEDIKREYEKRKSHYERVMNSSQTANQNVSNILVKIMELIINENSEMIEKFAPHTDEQDVINFLAKLDENSRMDIFSKAAIERMKTAINDIVNIDD